MVYSLKFTISTKGFCDVVDVTDQVANIVSDSNIKNGIVVVFVIGSTAGVTTIETGANLEADLRDALEVIAPENPSDKLRGAKKYHHDEKWHDGNGFSHVRASLVGPSVNVPFVNGELMLGTWQQIVLCDFDNRSRNREVAVQIIGEGE